MQQASFERNCGTCRFWAPFHRDNLGECHRYPPTVVGMQQVPDEQGPPMNAMPLTDKTDWCGEWQQDVRRSNGA